jgi:hypothetical protein
MYLSSPVTALPGARDISAFTIDHERLRYSCDGINVMASGPWLLTMPELNDSTISVIFGGLFFFGILVGWPAVTTVLGLMRSEKLLRKLYWRFIVAVDNVRGSRDRTR